MNIFFTWQAPQGTHLTTDMFPTDRAITVNFGSTSTFGKIKAIEISTDRQKALLQVSVPDENALVELLITDGPEGHSVPGIRRFSSD